MGDISTVSEWVFFINYVDGELDEGMIGVDQQETNRVHLCCNSRFSGLTLEVPKRANTFGAILARHQLVLYRLVHMVFRYNLKHERDQSSQTSLKPRGSSRDQEYIRSAEVALNSRCQVGGETGRRVQWM